MDTFKAKNRRRRQTSTNQRQDSPYLLFFLVVFLYQCSLGDMTGVKPEKGLVHATQRGGPHPQVMEDAYGDDRHSSGGGSKRAPEPIVGTTGIGLVKLVPTERTVDMSLHFVHFLYFLFYLTVI
jgi:hypothetical protein